MEVHGSLVDGRERPLALDEAEHRSRRRVDDGDRFRAGRAQRHAPGRVVASAPDDARRRPAQLASLHERLGPLERSSAERLAVAIVQRPLEGGREHVAVEDPWVRVVEDGSLDSPLEQRLGLAHEELVERILAGHEHGETVTSPAGAPPLLTEARNRAREPDGDSAVEEADVDAELERVGRSHPEKLALHQRRSISRRCEGV